MDWWHSIYGPDRFFACEMVKLFLKAMHLIGDHYIGVLILQDRLPMKFRE